MELLTVAGPAGPVGIIVLARPPAAAHAILGVVDLVGREPDWGSFRRNRPFVEFFERYMRGELPQRPAILARARVRPGEQVYVIDPPSTRSPTQGPLCPPRAGHEHPSVRNPSSRGPRG